METFYNKYWEIKFCFILLKRIIEEVKIVLKLSKYIIFKFYICIKNISKNKEKPREKNQITHNLLT